MTTFNDLAEEVLINLEGFTMRQDRTTYLTAAIDNNDLSMSLASGDNIGKGILEIDDPVDGYDVIFDRAGEKDRTRYSRVTIDRERLQHDTRHRSEVIVPAPQMSTAE
jgi:hypothetical protein